MYIYILYIERERVPLDGVLKILLRCQEYSVVDEFWSIPKTKNLQPKSLNPNPKP